MGGCEGFETRRDARLNLASGVASSLRPTRPSTRGSLARLEVQPTTEGAGEPVRGFVRETASGEGGSVGAIDPRHRHAREELWNRLLDSCVLLCLTSVSRFSHVGSRHVRGTCFAHASRSRRCGLTLVSHHARDSIEPSGSLARFRADPPDFLRAAAPESLAPDPPMRSHWRVEVNSVRPRHDLGRMPRSGVFRGELSLVAFTVVRPRVSTRLNHHLPTTIHTSFILEPPEFWVSRHAS